MSEHNFSLIEKALLGTMMKENYLIDESDLQLDHFNSTLHKNIFREMQTLKADNHPVDPIMLITAQNPEHFGGANYVMDLMSFAAPEKFDSYKKTLMDHWRDAEKRRILHQSLQEDWPVYLVQKSLDALESNSVKHDTSIKQLLVDQYERPFKPLMTNPGVSTGLVDLDTILGGFRKQELTIIAARPSMGKSDAMINLALNAGATGYLPILFSLEMSENLLVDRLIANIGNYNRLKLRDPYELFSEQQKAKWGTVLGELDKRNIHIDDRGGLNIAEIKATARKTIRDNPGIEPIIFIDYLQKITFSNDSKNATRAQLVGEVSSGLKQMAKEFDCPVVCLSQLSRNVEQRTDKRPMMSDLRESGEIEQDADVVGFLYRDDYYDKESESQGILELIIAKQRNGPTATASIAYRKETGCMLNINWDQKK